MHRSRLFHGILLAALLAMVPFAAAQDKAILTTIDTPEAIWIQVDRAGFGRVYPIGIAPNGAISGFSVLSAAGPGPGTTPLPLYQNGAGFLLENGTFTSLIHPELDASPSSVKQTVALKLNPRREVVGWATDGTAVGLGEVGWVWRKGVFAPVEYAGPDAPALPPGIDYIKVTDVMGINAEGDMVGVVAWLDPADPSTAVTGWHAWLQRKGQWMLIDPPSSADPYPWDINERGDVLLVTFHDSFPFQRGWLRKADGALELLAVPADWAPPGMGPVKFTLGFGMNAQGHIVGVYVVTPGQPKGFVRRDGQYEKVDVPDSIDTAVFGINESGVMTGSFKNGAGIHGFIRLPRR